MHLWSSWITQIAFSRWSWIVLQETSSSLLAIVLSVLLRYTDSDCPFGIFKLLLTVSTWLYYHYNVHTKIVGSIFGWQNLVFIYKLRYSFIGYTTGSLFWELHETTVDNCSGFVSNCMHIKLTGFSVCLNIIYHYEVK